MPSASVIDWTTSDVANAIESRFGAFDRESKELFEMMAIDGHVLQTLAEKRMAGAIQSKQLSLLELIQQDAATQQPFGSDELKTVFEETVRLSSMLVVRRGR
jgi:hypothetical protein